MKFPSLFCILAVFFSLFHITIAKETTTSKTLVWATGTDSDGQTQTTQSPYTQKFKTPFTAETGTHSSGSIGLSSGTLARFRTYSSTTESSSGSKNAYIFSSQENSIVGVYYCGLLLSVLFTFFVTI